MHTATLKVHRERGFALIFALIVLLMLTLVGLSFSVQSLVDYQISENYVSRQEALTIADSGISAARTALQESDFTTLLSTQTSLPAYDASDEPAFGSEASRNAISMRTARNVNFASPPNPIKTYMANGMLTPPSGQVFGAGRYFTKVTNNTFGGSGSVFGKDTDPNVDTDYRILVRATGVRPAMAPEKVNSGSSARNSVAVIEAMLKRNMAFDLASPLSVNGPQADATFNGNKFYVDGYNHNGMTRAEITSEHTENASGAVPGLAAIYDNPGGGDAAVVAQALYDMLSGNAEDNVVGAPGIHVDDTPSVADITNSLRTSSNPDSSKVLDPDFVGKFVEAVQPYAQISYSGDTHLSGDGVQLGTTASPKITYVDGDMEIQGSAVGAGILIVRGTFEVGGSFEYDGIVLVVGEGEINLHGANEGIIGGVYIQNMTKNSDGHWISGTSTLRLNGNSDFYFSSDMVRMGLRLLPLELLEWREITPEISN